MQALFKKHIDRPERRLDARRVAVIEHGDVLGVTPYQAHLLDGERCAARGHRVLHSRLEHRYNVDVALHQVTLVLPCYGILGLVEAVEYVALAENLRVGRVNILSRLLLLRQDAARKAQHASRHAVDGEHHAGAEAVVLLAVVLEYGEARLLQHIVAVAVAARILGESVPLVEAVAQAEGLDDVVAQPAAVEVAQTHGAAHLVLVEQAGKILLRKLRHVEQGIALVVALLLLVGQFLFDDSDIVFLCKPAQRLGIGVVLVLHQETYSIAALAATKALVDALGRRHRERRRLLIMERTTANEVCSATFHRHKLSDDFLYTSRIHNALYGFLVYHIGLQNYKIICKRNTKI